MRYGNVEIKKQTQIFVTVSYYFRMQEYRKKLLMSKQISDDIKQFSYEICQKHKVIIRYMETDKGERCPVDICYDPTEMECRPIFIT